MRGSWGGAPERGRPWGEEFGQNDHMDGKVFSLREDSHGVGIEGLRRVGVYSFS